MKSALSFAGPPKQAWRCRRSRGSRPKRPRRLGLCWATGRSLLRISKKDCGGFGFASSLNLLVFVAKIVFGSATILPAAADVVLRELNQAMAEGLGNGFGFGVDLQFCVDVLQVKV